MADVGIARKAAEIAFNKFGLMADEAKALGDTIEREMAGNVTVAGSLRVSSTSTSTAGVPLIVAPQDEIIIVNGRDVRDVSNDAMRLILAQPATTQDTFAKGGEVCRVVRHETQGAIISPHNTATLRAKLRDIALWRRRLNDGSTTPADPTSTVAEDILAKGADALPVINRVVCAPVMRADGSILLDAGYDASSRLYFAAPANYKPPVIPLAPSQADAVAAMSRLADVVCDFPFVSNADRANWLGMLLTAFARLMIEGSVPAMLAVAPQQANGKSMLCFIPQILISGLHLAEATPDADDISEWRKSLLALALEGRSVIVYDNAEGKFGNAPLAAAITTGAFSARKLGVNESAVVNYDALTLISGNNVTVTPDMAARIVPVKIDAKMSNPQLRDVFKHSDLLRWVKENALTLAADALTVLKAWHIAGRPAPSRKLPLGRFARWQNVIGGALEFAGVQGFLNNYADFVKESNDEDSRWELFITGMADLTKGEPTTVGEMYDRLCEPSGADLREFAPKYKVTTADDDKARATWVANVGFQLRPVLGKRFGENQARVEKGTRSQYTFTYEGMKAVKP